MTILTKVKALLLSLIMTAIMLPSMQAQQIDNYFKTDGYDLRGDAVAIWTINNGITNDDFGAPLGSGLLVLTAVGAGYAVAKRRRNLKKGTALLLAALMLVGMTACRKNIAEPVATSGNKVAITLNVGGGARVNVTGNHVNFETGDQILVASNGHYVGTLTANQIGENITFSGDITDPVVGQPLYFYFLGNKATGTLTPGTSGSTSCTVNISDQTDYPHLPVISMGVSINRSTGETVNYASGTTSYEAQLHNKASLMKLNVNSASTRTICITGMNNKVTVDFGKVDESGDGLAGDTDQGFSYSVDETDGGLIKIQGSDEPERWIIVLPQAELALGGDGTAYTNEETQRYKGNRPALDAISSNQYLSSGVALTLTADNSTIVDLSKLVYHYRAKPAETLTGTLAGNYRISIMPGATITLSNATINGVHNNSYNWAGLNCTGNATINLANGTTNTVKGFNNNYPGIYVPSGSTLTIQGTGTLDARSNGWASGIGGGRSIACGNITINGGTITATGGNNGAGIGCGKTTCGNISITGGTITATGGSNAAGIGGSTDTSCGTITISGGTVTATGGSSGAGIGSGCRQSSSSSCGIITISGGTVTATGGSRSAGIGCGANASCGNITIANTVTRVTATKGGSATNSIGAGNNGSCGTVTIGGTEYWKNNAYQNGGNTYLPTSPLIYKPLPQGALSGLFTVSNDDGITTSQVYFSQGNLKYSAGTWSFHTNQYDMCFTSEGSVSANYTSSGTFDLFGYGTSGYNDKYPYMTDMNGSYYYDDLTGSTGSNYDWGVHNTISNGGTGWRTPTINEWDYLLNQRVTSSNVRYAKATVNGVAGLIILPDDWSTGYYNLSSVANSANSSFNETNITLSDWSSALEAHGAVFLPVFSYREGTTVVDIVGYTSFYWSSTYYGYVYGANNFYGANCLSLAYYESDQNVYSFVATNFPGPLYDGHFVRLVKDAN